MNREQIEAWLALEGWHGVSTAMEHWLEHPDVGAAYAHADGEKGVHEGWVSDVRRGYNRVPISYFSDTKLQLIYQEIIKHEKD